MQILHLDDESEYLKTCKMTVDDRNEDDEEVKIEYTARCSLDSLNGKDDDLAGKLKEFNGIILDLKFDETTGSTKHQGEVILNKIKESDFFAPVVFLTGLETSIPEEVKHKVDIFTKGEINQESGKSAFDEAIDRLVEYHINFVDEIFIKRNWLDHILAGVYENSFYLLRENWISYLKQMTKEEVQEALKSHIVNHFVSELKMRDTILPAEYYTLYKIHGKSEQMQPGTIFKGKKENSGYIVLITPACDLVLRGEKKTPKVSHFSFCKISEFNIKWSQFKHNLPPRKTKNIFNDTIKKEHHGELDRSSFLLPYVSNLGSSNFSGGIVDFTTVSSLSIEQFKEDYDECGVQISPIVYKDLQNILASHFSRQGKPDLNYLVMIESGRTQNND